MGKHGKKKDETSSNPVIRALKGNKKVPESRRASDIEILDSGWNATQEAKDFASMDWDEYRRRYFPGRKH
jgi:hypothetical protein